MLKGSLSTAITLFFVQGLRFVSGVLIGRYYGAEASGRLTLIVTVMGIFAIFINFGVKEALQKLIPELREKYNLKTAYAIFLKGNQLILIFFNSCCASLFHFTLANHLLERAGYVMAVQNFSTIFAVLCVG